MKFFNRFAKKQEQKDQEFLEAVKEQNIDKVKKALKTGVDVNIGNAKAIKWALYKNDVELSTLLIKNKANFKFENAFVYPVINNNHELFDLLKSNGMKPNSISDEPLLRAILTNNAEMIDKIVESYDDIKDSSNEELLKFCAKDNENYYAFLHLLDSIENISFDLFDQVYCISQQNGSSWALDRLRDIKNANEEVNANKIAEQNGKLQNILTQIVISGDVENMKEYIKRGFDISYEDDIALRYSAYYNHSEIFDILINAGADISADDNGALRWAVMQDSREIITKLLDLGADPKIGLKAADDRNMKELSKFFKEYESSKNQNSNIQKPIIKNKM